MLLVRVFIKNNLYGHPLNYLREIPFCFLRREEGEDRVCSCHNALDRSFELLAGISIDFYLHLLPDLCLFQLGLFVMRRNIDAVGGD